MIRWVENVLESEVFLSSFKGQSVALIVDENFKHHYQDKLDAVCKTLKAILYTVPSGERYKTRETKEKLENLLLKRGYDRSLHLIAIGGGVTTDLAGFIAATFHRGIRVSFVPTTLMAMVDAAIGGKNGVNVPEGKNLIGTLHHPEGVWCDQLFLNSLSKDQIRSGMAEMVKHGLIADPDYFRMLSYQSLDKSAIQKSQMIKLSIIKQNEEDRESRHLLNFGHTVGHALEKMSAYQMLHGDAVALGILLESALSHALGILPKDHYQEIIQSIKFLDYPLRFQLDGIYQAMCSDKKSKEGVPHFILLEKIGQAYRESSNILFPIDERLIATTFERVRNDLHCH